ncbi:MAG: helix-turn-helix transcriptional regulator [Spirochaetota bacterium]|uniref:helix-turn-helix domain-containing protein n=1 Tax=Candidatus Avelusimicrobium faecicola TaxID=3416205 RepID=UPI002A634BF8|nr:helix-turn-helix domain-containing protein [Spirochaetota bacterium]MDE3276875.1 helix-turn-helix transcriptional regulator [Spirochaetota bacterium]
MKALEELERYRLEHRISQVKLAQMLGVSFATVNRWFNTRCQPNRIQQYHIEKFLKEHKS